MKNTLIKFLGNRFNKEFIGLNIILFSFYFVVLSSFNIGIDEDIMFSTPDSRTYLGVSSWILGSAETNYTLVRPFFYPLLISITYGVFGVIALWLVQFLMWLISINLIYLSLKRLTCNTVLSFFVAIIAASNVSYLAHTLHGLTEVITVFFISVLVYTVAVYKENYTSAKFYICILFILSVLTAIKPVFYLPTLFHVFFIFPVFYFRKHWKNIKFYCLILIALAPIVIQLSIMKSKHDVLKISEIGSYTFYNYLFLKGYQNHNQIDYYTAKEQIEKLTKEEKNTYMLLNKKVFIAAFFENLKENLKSSASMFVYPVEFTQKSYYNFMNKMNEWYYYIHLLFAFLWLISMIFLVRKKAYDSLMLNIILAAFLYYIILTSGISYMQGDRLTMPTIPIWLVLYPVVFVELIKGAKSLKFRKH
ncbi:MAG: hypothetical protein ACK4K0_05130 [Flavobacteriales bacterium]